MYPFTNQSKLRPRQPQVSRSVPLLAPVAGINAIQGLAFPAPSEAVFSYNMIPSAYGVTARDGYVEWATNVGTGGVRTVIPYTGSAGEDKLFACAEDGIYDITIGSTSPSQVLAFGSADDTSGYGIFTTYTTNAGKFCVYTDETNGYQLYTESTGNWTTVAQGASPGEIDGTNPADFAFCMVWKNRLFFVQKDSASAWYLDAGAITGTVTEFNFGNKFKYGGTLVGLYNWTVDGGEGIDDYLVAISSAGDVAIYKGTDPDTASTFDIRGIYYIGPPPAGRRVAGTFGGELYLLSSYGLLPISKLLAGQPVINTNIYITQKITPLINTLMRTTRNQRGWEIRLLPTQNLLMVSTPKQTSSNYLQFVQSLDTQGWATYRDFPYETGESWNGQMYFGTSDNRIMLHTGNLDNVTLAVPDEGDEIEWSLLTWFQDLSMSGTNKITQFIRPTFVTEKLPAYVTAARFDYNILEASAVPIQGIATGDLWDVALWDEGLWGSEFFTANRLGGAAGIGRSVAIALRGTSSARTTLVKFDLVYTEGNVL